MNQFDIKHALEDKIREIGGEIIGAGCLMVAPFTMDFSFMLGGKKYAVTLVNREEYLKYLNSKQEGTDAFETA
jgi:hypothetical protein